MTIGCLGAVEAAAEPIERSSLASIYRQRPRTSESEERNSRQERSSIIKLPTKPERVEVEACTNELT
eukprot:scaffold6286_cov82-Skeletonema_menzelii.AAC.2